MKVSVSASNRPRPITMRWSAVSAISLIRWLETSTVRPCAARSRMNVRTHTIPSGSSPLTGSSNINAPGSPSIAAAMPRRWDMPSENSLTRRVATSVSPVSSSTCPTRTRGKPLLWARDSK